jgi:hypothetical protein
LDRSLYSFSFYYRNIDMPDAKLVSSPLISEDGAAASAILSGTREGTTVTLTTTYGEESEETPEARALAQGPHNYTTSFFCYQ